MDKIDYLEYGLTKQQLVEKYGMELTDKILKSSVFEHATVMLNDKKEPIFYYIDIKHALREIEGKKTIYFD